MYCAKTLVFVRLLMIDCSTLVSTLPSGIFRIDVPRPSVVSGVTNTGTKRSFRSFKLSDFAFFLVIRSLRYTCIILEL